MSAGASQAAESRQACAQILTVEKFHRDVRHAAPLAVIEHIDHVRASKLRRGLRLALKTHANFLAFRLVVVDELQRTAGVE
jgi:hypothetical protein